MNYWLKSKFGTIKELKPTLPAWMDMWCSHVF